MVIRIRDIVLYMNTKKNNFYKNAHTFLDELPNVELNFGPISDTGTHPLEQVYIYNIFKELSKWSFFNKYQFYIIGANAKWDFKIDNNTIVFYLSNEDHKIPNEILKAKAVFSPYCPIIKCPKNCFPIPLGYNGSLSNLPIKPIYMKENIMFSSLVIFIKEGYSFILIYSII